MVKDNVLPDIWFGHVGDRGVDWREAADDFDADDEELAETPQDVIDLLGFDPKELDEGEKQVGIVNVLKGGVGSGSWNGPGDPRFAQEGSGKEGLTLFHGTCGKHLKGILKNGIEPRSKRNFESGYYTGARANSVFVAENLDDAKFYATNAMVDRHDEVGVILKVEIPEGPHLRIDTEHMGTGNAFFTKKIPPEWIKGYVAYTTFKGKFKIVEEYNSDKKKKQSSKEYYIPILIKNPFNKED